MDKPNAMYDSVTERLISHLPTAAYPTQFRQIADVRSMTVLIIEDEPKLAAFISQGLEEHGWTTHVAMDGPLGCQAARDLHPEVIVLDLLLPGLHGLDVCREIRTFSAVPILMLTALGTTDDKVTGLESGADDYLVKPFQFEELVARLRALARRSQPPSQQIYQVADLVVDAGKRTVSRGGKEIALTPREYGLLVELIREPGATRSRSELAERVWGITFDTGTNVIDVYVNYLRNKVDKPFSPRLIHTVFGTGYVLKVMKEQP